MNGLESIRAALCKVEVRGPENLQRLLGCINALDQLIKAVKQEEQDNGD